MNTHYDHSSPDAPHALTVHSPLNCKNSRTSSVQYILSVDDLVDQLRWVRKILACHVSFYSSCSRRKITDLLSNRIPVVPLKHLGLVQDSFGHHLQVIHHTLHHFRILHGQQLFARHCRTVLW